MALHFLAKPTKITVAQKFDMKTIEKWSAIHLYYFGCHFSHIVVGSVEYEGFVIIQK